MHSSAGQSVSLKAAGQEEENRLVHSDASPCESIAKFFKAKCQWEARGKRQAIDARWWAGFVLLSG